jgi:hypothetical protein
MGKRGKALKRRRAGLDPPSSAAASSESANRFAAANEDDSSESDDEDEDMDADEIERSLKRRAAATSLSGDGSGAGVSVMLGGLTEHEVATAIKVVTLLGQQLDLFRSRPFKHLRVAVHPLVAEQVRRYQAAGDTNNSGDGAAASGGGNNNGASRRDDRRSRLLSAGPDAAGSNRGRLAGLAPAERLKQMDRDALNARLLRAERLEKLDALNADGEDEEVARLRVPDGVAGLMLTAGSGSMGPGGPGVAKLLTAAGSAGGSSGKGSTKFAESSEALLATLLEARGLVVHVDAPAPSAQAAKLHNSIGYDAHHCYFVYFASQACCFLIVQMLHLQGAFRGLAFLLRDTLPYVCSLKLAKTRRNGRHAGDGCHCHGSSNQNWLSHCAKATPSRRHRHCDLSLCARRGATLRR